MGYLQRYKIKIKFSIGNNFVASGFVFADFAGDVEAFNPSSKARSPKHGFRTQIKVCWRKR